MLCIVAFLPIFGWSSSNKVIGEKEIKVAMRMIGHEVLLGLGDGESRVMPIEKTNGRYKIPFEFEFGFDPDTIIHIVDCVMTEAGITNDYLVEVEQCETKEIVHSFWVVQKEGSSLIPCRGRLLPKDCYNLLVTIKDSASVNTNLAHTLKDGVFPLTKTFKANIVNSTFLILLTLFLIGFLGYYLFQKRAAETKNPNLILIGASQFDQNSMSLTYENQNIELSHKETELLSLLHSSANETVTREEILQRVWGSDGDYVGRTLDVFISKLRKKLEADTSVKIVNLRGVGYKLVTQSPS